MNKRKLKESIMSGISDALNAAINEGFGVDPDYRTWRRKMDAQIEYDMQRHKTGSGKSTWWKIGDVRVLDIHGFAVRNLSYYTVKQALYKVDFPAIDRHAELTIDFGQPIGYCECVETTDDDNVIYVTRDGRNGKSRLVLDREPEICNTIFLVLDRSTKYENDFILRTIYVGVQSGREPWASKATIENAIFWSHHALVAPQGITEADDEGPEGYYGKFEDDVRQARRSEELDRYAETAFLGESRKNGIMCRRIFESDNDLPYGIPRCGEYFE